MAMNGNGNVDNNHKDIMICNNDISTTDALVVAVTILQRFNMCQIAFQESF